MICSGCNLEKPRYIHNSRKCKECEKKRKKAWYQTPRGKILRALENSRYRNNPKKRERLKAYGQTYYKKHGKKKTVNYYLKIREWRENNPQAIAAHIKVNEALRKGTITKAITCMDCGEKRKLLAHHMNYNFPLSVVWICYSCHKISHQVGT